MFSYEDMPFEDYTIYSLPLGGEGGGLTLSTSTPALSPAQQATPDEP